MGGFTCKCGYFMALKTGLEPYEGLLIPSKQAADKFEKLFDSFDELEDEPFYSKKSKQYDSIMNVLIECSQHTLLCPSCKRLWVSSGSGGAKMNSYVCE